MNAPVPQTTAVQPPTATAHPPGEDEPLPWIEVLRADAGASQRAPLVADPRDGSRALCVQAPAGADWVHIPVGLGERLICRCELPVDADGRVVLRLRRDDAGTWHLADTPDLRVLAPEYPAPPLPLPAPVGAPWQVAVLIDCTTRWFPSELPGQPPQSGLLLAAGAGWADLRRRLAAIGPALSAGPQDTPQVAIIGFADAPLPEVAAADLTPRAAAVSTATRFRPWDPSGVDAGLAALPASPGGDWVDALAEALMAAAALPWASGAHRLVLVLGDSPGYAILHPIGATADALAREHDVDLAAAALYARGIELATVYHCPPAAFSNGVARPARAILAATAAQYRRLASSPAHAWDSASLDPLTLAARLRERAGPLARGVSLGIALAA